MLAVMTASDKLIMCSAATRRHVSIKFTRKSKVQLKRGHEGLEDE